MIHTEEREKKRVYVKEYMFRSIYYIQKKEAKEYIARVQNKTE